VAVIAAGCTGGSAGLRASDPAVGASSGDAAAVYLTLHNEGDDDVRVTGAACDCSQEASLHVVEDLGDASMMTTVETLEIPAGESVELRPGGSHIMLEELRAPLREGSVAQVTIEVDRGDPIELEVPVVALESLNERVPR
jgi:copper(I)-binding protein